MSTSLYLEMDGFQLTLNKEVLPTFDSELFVEIEVEAGETVEGLVVVGSRGAALHRLVESRGSHSRYHGAAWAAKARCIRSPISE